MYKKQIEQFFLQTQKCLECIEYFRDFTGIAVTKCVV